MVRAMLITFLIISFLSGCKPSSSAYDKNPIKFSLSKNYSQGEVSEIIATALINLRWKIDEVKSDHITASLNRHAWKAKVILNIKGNEITIVNESMFLYEYQNTTGIGESTYREYKKKAPYNWLFNIQRNVLSEENKRETLQKIKENSK
jgi:hypothetical protein